MKKVLFVATVDSHIELFHLPFLKMFKERGYEVHVATESDKKIEYCDKKIKLPIKRSPMKLASNLRAVRELRKVMMREHYDIVHCHTPVGGVVARLAARKMRKNGTRVIYTAHGFHFYTGAPKQYWMMFYPVEKWLAKYTDTLITINTEDYERAKRKFGKRCRDIQYVPGVGVDEKKFAKKMTAKEKTALRKELELDKMDKVLIYPAELSKRKNQMWLMKALEPLFRTDRSYHLLLPGKDSLNGKCQKLAIELGLEKQIHFLGFRNDISELLQISDVSISSAKQEGLPVNLIEAAFAGLPIVATDCRGNRDVCKTVNGIIVAQGDAKALVEGVTAGKRFRPNNEAALIFTFDNTSRLMKKIYGIANTRHKVSIIIPVYNCSEYVADCFRSILSQSDGQNIEIIIIDDGSTDGSGRICDKFARENNCMKVFHRKNSGVSAARNFGLRKASGDYVYFVDADDVLLGGCIDCILRAVAHNPDVISIGYQRFNDVSVIFGQRKNCYAQKTVNHVSGTNFRFSLWQNVIKKDILEKNNLRLNEGLKFTEDMDLSLEMLVHARSIMVINGAFYGYRNSMNSATSCVSQKRIDDMIFFIDKWRERAKEMKDVSTKEYIKNFLAYQILILMGMSSILGDGEIMEKMGEYTDLLRSCGTIKNVFGYMCYRIFGMKGTAKIMEMVLVLKGTKKEALNV